MLALRGFDLRSKTMTSPYHCNIKVSLEGIDPAGQKWHPNPFTPLAGLADMYRKYKGKMIK